MAMGVIIKDNKLVIIKEPKTIYFDWSRKIDNNLECEINFIIKHIEHLAEHTVKNKISRLL